MLVKICSYFLMEYLYTNMNIFVYNDQSVFHQKPEFRYKNMFNILYTNYYILRLMKIQC